VIVAGADGFDWSSAGIAVAALVGLLVVSIAVLSALRERRDDDSTGGSHEGLELEHDGVIGKEKQ
jgi:hypothetical protein